MTPRLTIVIAVQSGEARLREVLSALLPQCGDDVEVLVAVAADDAVVVETIKQTSSAYRTKTAELAEIAERNDDSACSAPSAVHAVNLEDSRGGRPVVTVLEAPAGSLVPHLWRDGILAAKASRVALSVVHCRPSADWVANLIAADLDTFAGVGGAIANDRTSDARGWAIYMLRYLRYAPPFTPRETTDLPGDNVVYNRSRVMSVKETFAEGFWEPSVHARLAANGHRLLLDPAIESIHANGYGTFEFAQLRYEHGHAFGLERARAMPLAQRLAYAALGPLIPLVFGAKVVRLAMRNPITRPKLVVALPHLAIFLFAWGIGELSGVLAALVGARR